MKRKIFLSVVVPAYNEQTNFINGKLEAVYDYLRKQDYTFELVLVDDGSSDGTLNLLHDFGRGKTAVRVIIASHQGKGPTLIRGLTEARGENRLFTDFDQATPIEEIEKLLPFRQRGYDLVIGSREIRGAKREREPLYRHLMGKAFNLVVRLLAVRGIQDTQCGFKLMSEKAVETIFPKMQLYRKASLRRDPFTGAFDVELLFLATKLGFRIAEVPVYWTHIKTDRVNPIKDSWRMFMEVLKICWFNLGGYYR